MNARMNRLMSDYERIKRDFANNPYINITPVGGQPPERYHVTYNIDGIFLAPDGTVMVQHVHEVEIILTADYPRYKPVCQIFTPIWHPNFKDGQICIGDIWGAGESLSDIIVNIGDMIQYKSWNSSSPLSADAAKWALENKHMFPIGNVSLMMPSSEPSVGVQSAGFGGAAAAGQMNDFVITPEELQGITFIPSSMRMQQRTASGSGASFGAINFKTILTKGLIWAFIGALLGFLLTEVMDGASGPISESTVARIMGYPSLSLALEYTDISNDALGDISTETMDNIKLGLTGFSDSSNIPSKDKELLKKYYEYQKKSGTEYSRSLRNEFRDDDERMTSTVKRVTRLHSALWAGIIAMFIGLFLGIGEGVFYGSAQKAVMYGAIGLGISLVIGFVSGDVAQLMYSSMLPSDPPLMLSCIVRALGWSIIGLGVGAAAGLIKPELKRMLFCLIGGTVGAFIGGFLFDIVFKVIPNDMVSRAVGIIIMGSLIGLGVGLLEQLAKSAWLKVVRGDFEGKEFLVFKGVTSIGNNAHNMIVLFKDRLVSEHHCDIVQEGSRYMIVNHSRQQGTFVNGVPVEKQYLRRGDAIAVGNSVLIFQTK